MGNPQEEITGKRPGEYSAWHRKALPRWCYMTDGDWFEQRSREGKLKSVAYIETIQLSQVEEAHKHHAVWASKAKGGLTAEIEERMGVPAYVVWHNPECTDFLVLRIMETEPKRMNKDQYIEFIKNL